MKDAPANPAFSSPSAPLKIELNGTLSEVRRAKTIADLIEELALPAPVLLIEHNGIALRREEWTSALLADQDRVEIIRIVAGG